MAEVRGKVVVVTGGGQGIGRGIVELLLEREAAVVIADCDRQAGEELAARLDTPERVCFIHADVGDEESVAGCIRASVARFGGVDGLVNNAGIADPGATPVTELALAQWERMLRTNLTGAFLMAKHAVPHLQQRRGAIVNIASTRALQSEANTEAYTASKGGLVALTHALAISLAHRIRVNVILPGWIDVRAYRKAAVPDLAPLTDADHLQHPAGRVGVPRDIASLTAYLLSEEAAFITGQSFVVDGGMTRKMIYVE
ncbi:short-chain dehydrogenase/reductase SDR [Desulfobulbus propionicus DSM 2032]|uniref:Short-chain dehydrogenase/reductase SDR n=1 Tax=Desulfobulbus propionicus (strain ATCC 33891 / DSM 2032 / VKM B-1956 / 1pr3) TaxID=577650 RepID=A0A7U3YLA8_DESPD|nr:glucose 1-dehydrogenase [Desulfobulbus propionicus]ADW17363.1 short-chain dehydrogenase/reductase SDR [Desulfobulbus propionicus DSM 2032]